MSWSCHCKKVSPQQVGRSCLNILEQRLKTELHNTQGRECKTQSSPRRATGPLRKVLLSFLYSKSHSSQSWNNREERQQTVTNIRGGLSRKPYSKERSVTNKQKAICASPRQTTLKHSMSGFFKTTIHPCLMFNLNGSWLGWTDKTLIAEEPLQFVEVH